MVRLSFPNFTNSFQKCHNFYTTQQNVSHPSPLFLTRFWDHNMHQSVLCWQMRLSRLTTLQAIIPPSSGWWHENEVFVRNPSRMPSNNVLPIKLGLTNWAMEFDTISPFTSTQYIKTPVIPRAEQGSADSPKSESNLYCALLPANKTFLKELLYWLHGHLIRQAFKKTALVPQTYSFSS